jgi:hypothetical protein
MVLPISVLIGTFRDNASGLAQSSDTRMPAAWTKRALSSAGPPVFLRDDQLCSGRYMAPASERASAIIRRYRAISRWVKQLRG